MAVLEGAIQKIKAASWFTKLPSAKRGKLLQSFQKVGTFITELRTTKMCFIAGTLVITDNGTKSIENIEIGDRVWSKDPATGNTCFKPVVETIVTNPTRLHHIYYRAGNSRNGHVCGTVCAKSDGGDNNGEDEPHGMPHELVCTAEHPFYVRNYQQFIPAKRLVPGDLLELAGGGTAFVEGNYAENAPAGSAYTTYNFEVEDYHTYFVGEYGVLVHNTAPNPCTRVFSMFAKRLKANGNKAWTSYAQTRDRIAKLSDSVLLRMKLFNEARAKFFNEKLFGEAGPWHNLAGQTLAGPGGVGTSKRLGSNLEKVLGIKKPTGMASHHIVEKAANPEARAIIERAGLDIDEASNGVWMPSDTIINEYKAVGKSDWLEGVGPRHQGSHSGRYHLEIRNRLVPLDGLPAAIIRDELQKIAKELIEGTFPW